ncbi:MAG: hypothetical protein J3K34DRAFT_156674 [Monoraphidium minutum]|nr:MAG: hypothetical protein J3K34DRAFT_156674 [Monoraphidium minutum]
MLISMLLDDLEDGAISALYQVGPYVITIKQRPTEGRVLDKDLEEQQEAMAKLPLEAAQRAGEYVSAFPNVGLVVWQAGFVLAEWLIRAAPLGGGPAAWAALNVLELGCGVGQLGIPLACAGAAVTLTDLPHVTPLTRENAGLNAAALARPPRVVPFIWGSDPAALGFCCGGGGGGSGDVSEGGSGGDGGAAAAGGEGEGSGGGGGGAAAWQRPLDMVVAADVLYEPQYYGQLLDSLVAFCRMGGGRGAGGCEWARGHRIIASAAQARGGGGEAGSSGDGGGGAAGEEPPASGSGGSGGCGGGLDGGALPRARPLCFICYRRRRYKEDGFEEMALARGFGAVVEVPAAELHPDYQEGYCLIELVHDGRLLLRGGAAGVAGAGAAPEEGPGADGGGP